MNNDIARRCFHTCTERKAQPKQESLFVVGSTDQCSCCGQESALAHLAQASIHQEAGPSPARTVPVAVGGLLAVGDLHQGVREVARPRRIVQRDGARPTGTSPKAKRLVGLVPLRGVPRRQIVDHFNVDSRLRHCKLYAETRYHK
jgi:hypothetical protein